MYLLFFFFFLLRLRRSHVIRPCEAAPPHELTPLLLCVLCFGRSGPSGGRRTLLKRQFYSSVMFDRISPLGDQEPSDRLAPSFHGCIQTLSAKTHFPPETNFTLLGSDLTSLSSYDFRNLTSFFMGDHLVL